MVQNASRIQTATDRLVSHQKMIKDHYGLNRMRTLPRTVSFPSSSTGEFGGTNPASGNYLPIIGGTMSGPIAFNPPSQGAIKIDINNTINIGPSDNNSQYSGNILLDILGSASTQLDTIEGATFDGQYLVLRGIGLPQTITQRISLNIANIVGDGVTNIITVTVNAGTGSILLTNNKVNITGTTGGTFDKAGVVITKTGADTFTYDLGVVGSAIATTNGQVVRGNVQTYDGKDIVVTGADTFKAWVLIFDTIIANGAWRVLTPPITSGGGLSEPVILGINTLTPQTSPTVTPIAWNTKNPQHIVIDRNITFSFTNLPSSGSYEGILVIIDIDGTGNYDSPIWPASVTNPPVIPTTPSTRFSVLLYTIDGGTTVTHATSVGSSSSSASTLGELTDVTLTAPANDNFLAFDTTTSMWINQTASQAGVAQGNLGNLASTAVNVAILPATTNVTDFGSELKAWRIIHAREYEITTASGSPSGTTDTQISREETGTAGNEINIFHNNVKSVASSSQKGEYRWNIDGVLAARLSKDAANVERFDVDILEANSHLQLQSQVPNPASNGVMANVSGRVKVFTNGVLKDLTDIGGGATIELSNLGTTSINANLTPQAGLLLGSDGIPWSRVIGNKFSLGTAGTFAASDNAIIADAALGMEYHTPLADFHSFYFNLIKRIEIGTSTLKFVSGGTMQAQIFQLSGNSAVDPVTLGQFNINGSDVALFAPNFKLTNTTVGSSGTANFVSYRKYAAAIGHELGSLRFDGGISPTQYARIIAGVGEATDSGLLSLQVRTDNSGLVTGVQFKGDDDNANTYMTINSRINSSLGFGNENVVAGAFKISPVVGSTQLGIVVQDNISFTMGTVGTLAMPSSLLPAVKTRTNMDAALGTHRGACGFDEGLLIRLWIRHNSGSWYGFDFDASVTTG